MLYTNTAFTEYSCINFRQEKRPRHVVSGARQKQLASRRSRKHMMIVAVICIVLGVLIGSFLLPGVKSEAADHYVDETRYTSVRVEDGMTLSQIEQMYNTSSSVSASEYIDEIRSMNHLKDTVIHSSSYLVIPSYEKVLK